MHRIETDYLVVGAGTMGMAFTDTIVAETDASVVVVDRGHQPGGHWTSAYPFVRLHQPSAFYGVNSRTLGTGSVDAVGWNEGLYELATGGEVCAYFDQVMHQYLLPSGRVTYFPMTSHDGDGRLRTLAGEEHTVRARRVVDTTYLQVVVPSMRPPAYEVAPGVDCVPPNDLPRYAAGRQRYVIVGAGKTGMDACLWLLRHGIAPERLTWVMPRDSWLLDRASLQPRSLPTADGAAAIAGRIAAINAATSIEDLFERLEGNGNLIRLDPSVRPGMYRCATVSRAELEQLRRIDDVVRMGRVTRIEPERIVLAEGVVATESGALYVDCSTSALTRRPPTPVFDGDTITMQAVRGCQPAFSAAMVAHVEATVHDEARKNALCTPVPYPDTDLDWLRMTVIDSRNQIRWLDDPDLTAWLASSRLDLVGNLLPEMPANPRAGERVLSLIKTALGASAEKLEKLLE